MVQRRSSRSRSATRPIPCRAGKYLFEQGYYVQSVLFPAVPYHAGVLRVQCNANHDDRSIDGLIDAFASLTESMGLPAAIQSTATDTVPIAPRPE